MVNGSTFLVIHNAKITFRDVTRRYQIMQANEARYERRMEAHFFMVSLHHMVHPQPVSCAVIGRSVS